MTEQKRVALITGGIGGIGTAICQRLTQDGYQVVANCHPSEAEAAAAWRAARAACSAGAPMTALATACCEVSSSRSAASAVLSAAASASSWRVVLGCIPACGRDAPFGLSGDVAPDETDATDETAETDEIDVADAPPEGAANVCGRGISHNVSCAVVVSPSRAVLVMSNTSATGAQSGGAGTPPELP